jgi:hypothetical protein
MSTAPAAVPERRRPRWRTGLAIATLAVPYVLLGIAKHIVPLPRLARWAWLRPVAPRDRDAEQRAIRCVVRLRRLTLGDRGDCVQGSLVLYRALSRAGASPHLIAGVRRDVRRLIGHAWVTVDGQVVAESLESVAPFTPTLEFGESGGLVRPPHPHPSAH